MVSSAKMAPSWIRIANDLPKESSPQPRKCSISSRWPVEETGKNSVSPSTTPSTAALTRSRWAEVRPSTAALIASKFIGCSGEVANAQHRWESCGSALLAQWRHPGNEKRHVGGQFALPRRLSIVRSSILKLPGTHADAVSSSALPAFTLCAPHPRRIRHRGAAGGRTVLGAAGGVPAAQSGRRNPGAGAVSYTHLTL